ncbi:hypothetical protein YSA_11209 [Pseudomonas putida ND6]|uniref:Uncharacterized protein n=1 Tax=Pseudomonas putida ND6 TaxID=231023 RepID=I3V526_PSEPU|nr:hypothetical protein YSA_11209 [Pseudomonas putida ND6]
MAGEGGAVAGVVGGVVHSLNVREPGKVHQAQTQQAGTDGDDYTLAEGNGGSKAVLFGAGDGHDAILCFLWAMGERGSPGRGRPRECNSARPPRGVHERQAGLRACEEELGSWNASPSHAVLRGTVVQTLHSLTVAGAAPALSGPAEGPGTHRFPVSPPEGHLNARHKESMGRAWRQCHTAREPSEQQV